MPAGRLFVLCLQRLEDHVTGFLAFHESSWVQLLVQDFSGCSLGLCILQRYRGDFESSSHLGVSAWPDEVTEAFLIKKVTDSKLHFRWISLAIACRAD